MKTTDPVDAARVALLLAELRLSAVKLVWADLAAQADKEGWPAARFLAALAEHEVAERARRRIERHLAEAKQDSHGPSTYGRILRGELPDVGETCRVGHGS
jgi:DNA replication protein DnaC